MCSEFPGYGLCKGQPCETSVNRAVITACQFARDSLMMDPSRIIIYGRYVPVAMCVMTAYLLLRDVSLNHFFRRGPGKSLRNSDPEKLPFVACVCWSPCVWSLCVASCMSHDESNDDLILSDQHSSGHSQESPVIMCPHLSDAGLSGLVLQSLRRAKGT